MNHWLVDTNCLVSFFTDRSPAQHSTMVELFEAAGRLESRLVFLSHVIGEFVYTLQSVYDVGPQTVASMLADMARQPGVELSSESDLPGVLTVWPARVSDYGDAVVAAAAMSLEIPVLTFDKSFARQLKRLEIPHEVPS